MKDYISRHRTYLMGLAMIAIILFHLGFTPVFRCIGPFGVDIFMFVSGFGCTYALQKSDAITFFRRRLMRLLPSCLLVGCIVYAADHYLHAEKTVCFMAVSLFSLHRWYIQAILICYALCPILVYFIKKYGIHALAVIFVIASAAGIVCPNLGAFRLSWAFARMPVFIVGIYVAINDLKITPPSKFSLRYYSPEPLWFVRWLQYRIGHLLFPSPYRSFAGACPI